MRRHPKASMLVAALLVVAGALLASVGSASAATVSTHPFVGSLTAPESVTPKGPFRPSGIAVNQSTGNLYAVDANNEVIHVFGPSGKYLFTIDGSDAVGGRFAFDGGTVDSIAVDNSDGPNQGRIYVKNYGNQIIGPKGPIVPIDVLSPTGEFLFALVAAQSPFENGEGLAVDSAGNLAIGNKQTVVVIDPDSEAAREGNVAGALVREVNAADGNLGIPGIAFDSTDNLYVTYHTVGRLNKYDAPGTREWTVGESSIKDPQTGFVSTGIGVPTLDQSAARIYATDDVDQFAGPSSVRTIAEYDPAGILQGRFGLSVLAGLGVGAGVAVDESSGKVYAADPALNRIAVFGPQATSTAPDSTAGAATAITDTTATLHGTVNPSGVLAAARFQYRRAKTRGWRGAPLIKGIGSGTVDIPIEAEVSGLSQNTTYEVRVQAANEANGAVSASASFTTFKTSGAPQAIVTIDPASAVKATSVHLSGTVDPNGSDTKWRFEYATENSFEEDWIPIGKDQAISSGSPATAVSAGLTGLEPNSHYYARMVAANAGGPAASPEIEFKTAALPPEATTIAAGCLTPESACLGAAIDAKNSATTYYFEYGPDQGYGSLVPLAKDGSAGSALGLTRRTEQVTGLEPDTVYHYRVIAENPAGTTASEDATFSTAPLASEVEAHWPRRGFEPVSPPDKGNQPLFFRPGEGKSVVSPDGNRVSSLAFTGSPGSTTGANVEQLSVRAPDGQWTTRSLAPPAAQQPFQGERFYTSQAMSRDLTSFVFSIGREGEDGSLFRIDDKANQSLLGTTFPVVSAGSGFEALSATSDSRHAVLQLETSDGLVHFFEGGNSAIATPACGFDYSRPRDGNDTPGYRWMAEQDTVLFLQSAGNGPCDVPEGVFRIDVESGDTELISGPQTTRAAFVRTNPDGSAAIYTKANEVYRWSRGEGSACLTCATGGSEVLEGPLLVSNELERVYFLSPKRLVPGQGLSDAPCRQRMDLACNLYVWHEAEIEFIAITALNQDDVRNNIPLIDYRARRRNVTAAATDDGRVLVFLSDDPRTSADGVGSSKTASHQLYRYDDATGRVECVSCWDSPEPMVGGPDDLISSSPTRLLDLTNVSGDGRTVPFSTTLPLVKRDVNGTRDVYEWHEGLVRLVTDGVTEVPETSLGNPIVWGISDDGRNLIFSSGGRLVGNEFDALTNVYNARLGGGTVLEEPPAPCVEDACQGPLEAPPSLSNPGSSAFSGPGNEQAAQRKKAKGQRKKAKAKRRKQRQRKQKQRQRRAMRERGGAR